MAWHRYRRERRDYSYLDGQTAATAFAQAYRDRAFGRDIATWPAHVNQVLLRLFEGRERLTPEEAIEATVADRVAMGKRGAGRPDPFDGDVAGNTLAWGVHLGLVTESVEHHRYVWTMPDREPWFVKDGSRLRQVRGLTAGQAADQARADAALARRRATLQAKAADQAAPFIEAQLHRILRYAPDFVIPAGNPRGAYPSTDLALYLPTVAAQVRMVEVLPIVAEAHRDMEPKRQREWLDALQKWGWEVEYQSKRPRAPVMPPAEEELSDEDAAALGDLG